MYNSFLSLNYRVFKFGVLQTAIGLFTSSLYDNLCTSHFEMKKKQNYGAFENSVYK